MNSAVAMGINEKLNVWQQLAASEVRQRKVEFIFCSNCRRYCWSEILNGHRYQCLECGCLVEEQEACPGRQVWKR